MNKIMNYHTLIIICSIIIVMLFTSCGLPAELTNPPTRISTDDWYLLPTYVHQIYPIDEVGFIRYIPNEKSKIVLEFDYPISWYFAEHIDEVGDQSISLLDHRFLTLPTPSPDSNHHPTPNDYGSIHIWIIQSKPGRTVESETEDQKTRLRNAWWATFLKDYKIALDGFGARVIEHHIQVPEIHTSLMFERAIYFFAENEIYEIRFTIAEKDRGGEFEQGYEIFIDSLKIIR